MSTTGVMLVMLAIVLITIIATTDGKVSIVLSVLVIMTFILVFVLLPMSHFSFVPFTSQLAKARDTVLVHDTTVIIDSVFVYQEGEAAQDGTETASEPTKALENASRDKGGTRKRHAASKTGQIVVFFIHTRWCGWCRKMEATTWKNASLKKEMSNDSVAFVDVNTSTNATKWIDGSVITVDKALSMSGYSGSSIPATVIKHGSYDKTLVGYLSASEIMCAIKEAK